MNHRKIIAILLALALPLSIAPTASANVVEGLSTTFNAPTVTSEAALADTSNDSDHPLPGIVYVDKINVRITNIKDIQVNPYGMSIASPDDPTQTSSDSIVTAPIFIENRTGTQVEVTATATATPEGDVALDSNPTRYAYKPDPMDNPAQRPKEERIYLYLQLTDQVNVDEADDTKKPVWLTKDDGAEIKEVITKEGGSAPLTVTMKKGTEQDPAYAALQIFGNTSLPSYYGSWHDGNGFKVNLVLSFMPKQDDYYSISFDAFDYWFTRGKSQKLYYPVEIIIEPAQGDDIEYPSEFINDDKRQPLRFEAGYLSTAADINTPRADNNMVVKAKKNITFTVKTGEEAKGDCYLIRKIILIRGNNEAEELYDIGSDRYVQYSQTIDVSKIDPQENLTVHVVLNKVSIP